MPKKFKFAGVTGKGRTVAEAKQDAERQLNEIREMTEGHYWPILIRKDEYLLVMWREPQWGWTYRILALDEIRTETVQPIVSADWDCEECERAARRHFAQYLYNDQRTGEDVILNDQDRREHLHWVRWQRRYKEARNQGKSDEEARAYASAS